MPTKARNYETHFFQSTQLSIIRASLQGKPGLRITAMERTLQPSPAHPVWATSQEANGHVPRQSASKVPALTRSQSSGTAKNMESAQWTIVSLTQLSKRTMCLSDMEASFWDTR